MLQKYEFHLSTGHAGIILIILSFMSRLLNSMQVWEGSLLNYLIYLQQLCIWKIGFRYSRKKKPWKYRIGCAAGVGMNKYQYQGCRRSHHLQISNAFAMIVPSACAGGGPWNPSSLLYGSPASDSWIPIRPLLFLLCDDHELSCKCTSTINCVLQGRFPYVLINNSLPDKVAACVEFSNAAKPENPQL